MSLHQEKQIYDLEQKVYKLLDRVGKLETAVKDVSRITDEALTKIEEALKQRSPDNRTVNMVREDEGLPPLSWKTTK